MKAVRKITAIFDRTNNLLAVLAGVLVVFIMLGTAADVLARYLLGTSILWMFEIVEYSLLFITFLAAAWLLREEGHVKMDLVLNRLKPGASTLLNIITSILSALICLVITWYGVEISWSNFQKGIVLGTILEPPKFILLAIIPVGSFLLFIQFLRRSYGYLVSRRAALDEARSLRGNP